MPPRNAIALPSCCTGRRLFPWGAIMWISEKEDHYAIIEEIENSRDRPAAIVACAFLEDQLKERLKAVLRKGSSTVESLLDGTGLLGSLAAKNSMCYALGFYENDTRHNIEIIGKIRNAFAHRAKVDSFNSEEILKLCGNLRSDYAMLTTPFIESGEELPEPDPRDHFMYVAQGILLTLLDIDPDNPTKKSWYVHVPSPEKR